LSLGERPFVVGDRSFGPLDGRRGAVVALGALTDTAVERLPGALTPRAVGCCVKVFLEVIGGPRLVVAEHNVNRLCGQGDACVQPLDRGIVPGSNAAVEDLRRSRTVQT